MKSSDFQLLTKMAFAGMVEKSGLGWHAELSRREREAWNDVFLSISVWTDYGEVVAVAAKADTPFGGEPPRLVNLSHAGIRMGDRDGYSRLARVFAYLVFRHFRVWVNQ